MPKLKATFGALLFYTSLTLVFTFPLIIDINNSVFGYPGDSLANIWFYGWVKSAQPDLLSMHTDLLSYPHQLVIGNIFYGPWITTFVPLISALVTNEVFAYNVFIFLSFVLGGFFTFLVAYKLFGSSAGAVLAGLIFGFSQYHLWQSFSHLDLGSVEFIPLFVYCLLIFNEKVRESSLDLKTIFFLWLTFSLIFHTSFYYGYFALIVFSAAAFLTALPRPRRAVFYLITLVLFIMPMLPALLGLLRPWATQDRSTLAETYVPSRKIDELSAYGARPWDYLLPSISHPVFGRFVRNFYSFLREEKSYQFWSPFLPERANFLTFTGLSLSVLVLIKVWFSRQVGSRILAVYRLTPMEERRVFDLLCLSVVMFIVSLPATLSIFGFRFFLPSFFLFQVLPIFRVYARAGVWVLLGVALLSSLGFKILSQFNQGFIQLNLGHSHLRFKLVPVLLVIIATLVLFENMSFPPFPVLALKATPKAYLWLKESAGGDVIVEYPIDNSSVDIGGGCPSWLDTGIVRDYNSAYGTFYQRIHGKKILGIGYLSLSERVALSHIGESDSYEVLKSYKVSYLVWHIRDPMIGISPWPYPQENPLDECWRRRIAEKPVNIYPGFKMVAEFDDGIIYEVQ